MLTDPFADPEGEEDKKDAAARASLVSSATFFSVKPSELHVRGLLGHGAQAKVYKAEWTRSFASASSTIVVAVKQLNQDLGPLYRDREALTLLTEHPNLVKCFDSTIESPYLVVMEYCSGGSLFDLLYNSRQPLPVRQRVKMLLDVASGMRYLHAQTPCIVHRDLKSSNVLLTRPVRTPDQEPFAKVADFGLARTSSSSGSMVAMTVGVGTWRWMAPEVFDAVDQGPQGPYDGRVDVFSFAIVMYEALVRRMPYSERFPLESADPRFGLHVMMGLRPNLAGSMADYPPVLSELMQRGWSTEPADRPEFEELEREIQASFSTLPAS